MMMPTWCNVTLCLHFGNVLYLLAYAIRDIMWLRIIVIAASLSFMPYHYFQPEPMWEPIAWNTLFLLVNVVQVVLLILEKRPVFLGEEELRLYRSLFHTMKPREFAKLLSVAEWKRAATGKELLAQGQPVPELMLISTGRGRVELDGRNVASVKAGQFIGEMGFLTENNASARVVAEAPTDYLAWPVPKLRALLANAPALHVKLQGVLGCDMVNKLRRDGLAAAHPSLMSVALNQAGAE